MLKRWWNFTNVIFIFKFKTSEIPCRIKVVENHIQERIHLSFTNDIRNLIDIQDTNITFEENCIQIGTYKNKTCKFITGKLSYHPDGCEVCRTKNEDYTIYKNGTQTSRITLPLQGNCPAYLLLKKQRYLCKSCHYSFTAKTSVVKNIAIYRKT